MASNMHHDLYITFWNFLAYLRKYLDVIKLIAPSDTDPARTQLISMLTENLRPVLRADLAFIGYRDLDDSSDWLKIVKESVRPGPDSAHWQSPLIQHIEKQGWRLPYNGLDLIEIDLPTMLFDEGLQKLPAILEGLVAAVAISRLMLFGREYFLFFCDIDRKETDAPRYTDFDKAMLSVAIGVLGTGFQSGVRRGRQVQQDIEEAQTQQFLLDLTHELKTPIQAILADASNLQAELPEDLVELHEMASHNLSSAYQLSLLVDNIRLTLSGRELPDEPLVFESIEVPLREAITMLIGEAQAKGLEIRGPNTVDGQPLPRLPMYQTQLATAFKNLIHNAIVYSLPEANEYEPIEIIGHRADEGNYTIDIVNYGLEITQDEIEQDKLFNLRYRGEKARQVAATGSGLGLAFVRRTVERHSGQVSVASIPTGSPLFRNTFRIILSTTPSR